MRLISVSIVVCALAGCEPTELPGEPIGTYAISGSLEDNTCGQAALPAVNPLAFDVQIRLAGTSGNWIVGDPPGFEGVVDEQGAFLFGAESFSTVIQPGSRSNELEQPEDYINGSAVSDSAEVGCTLSIVEQIDGTIHRTAMTDAGVNTIGEEPGDTEVDDLVGENRIDMSPMPGSDCSRLLGTDGGPFLALPCYALYTISGELYDENE